MRLKLKIALLKSLLRKSANFQLKTVEVTKTFLLAAIGILYTSSRKMSSESVTEHFSLWKKSRKSVLSEHFSGKISRKVFCQNTFLGRYPEKVSLQSLV
jgi:hypothetical protein